jgi:hypothetical protein
MAARTMMGQAGIDFSSLAARSAAQFPSISSSPVKGM